MTIGALAQQALLVVAAPGLIVVLLTATFPLLRWGRAARLVAVAAVGTGLLLAVPCTHQLGQRVAAGWFLLAALVLCWPRARPVVDRIEVVGADEPG